MCMNAQLGDIESWDEVRTAYHVLSCSSAMRAATPRLNLAVTY